jgi:hypothetical protein
MTTYNHAYSIAFSVPKCEHADRQDAWNKESDKIIAALLTRIAGLLGDRTEYFEACDGYDTYEEV